MDNPDDDMDDSDFESDHEWKGLTSKELGKRLVEQPVSCKIDDMDGIPPKLQRKKGTKKGKCKVNQNYLPSTIEV